MNLKLDFPKKTLPGFIFFRQDLIFPKLFLGFIGSLPVEIQNIYPRFCNELNISGWREIQVFPLRQVRHVPAQPSEERPQVCGESVPVQLPSLPRRHSYLSHSLTGQFGV